MILLDTQILLWAMHDKRRLSPAAGDAIRVASRSRGIVAIANTTLWELAMTLTKGKVRVRGSVVEYLQEVERSFTVLPITGAIAARSMLFTASYPRDPADRIIAATAITHGLRLVTADKAIRNSGEVDCVW